MTYYMIDGDHSRSVPLCRHYFSAHFDDEPLQVLAGDGGLRPLAVNWALGVLTDGGWELLGAWPAPEGGPAFRWCVFDGLAARGVERLSFVLADAVADMVFVCQGATVFPSFARILAGRHGSVASAADRLGAEARRAVRAAASVPGARAALERLLARSGPGSAAMLLANWSEMLAQLKPFYALRPERRALIRRGDEVSEYVGLILGRAVRRHGPFANVDEAVSFVGRTLARAEAQAWSSALPAVRLTACRGRVSTARAGGVALGR